MRCLQLSLLAGSKDPIKELKIFRIIPAHFLVNMENKRNYSNEGLETSGELSIQPCLSDS